MDAQPNETERVRRIWDRFAANYDRTIGFAENLFFRGGREWACGQAAGKVLEVAVGTGLNLPHYPTSVDLTAIEISHKMLAVADARARRLGRRVDFRQGDAQHLPFPNDAFDTVVLTLSLCTIPGDRQAAAEVLRVLRPGGKLVLLEHVRSHLLPVRLVQRLIDPVSVKLYGDHQVRNPLDYLADVGFSLDYVERRRLGIVLRVIARKR